MFFRNEINVKKYLLLLSVVVMGLAAACTSKPALETMAYKRLPKALEAKMSEELSISGGADIHEPVTMYASDSLCIIQFMAVVKDPQYEGYCFPVRYAFVRDMVLSYATGRPAYAEYMSGCSVMDKDEIKATKARYKEKAKSNYDYYVAFAIPVAPEDL